MPEPTQPSSRLDYAPGAPRHRRRHRARKIAIALLLLSAIAVLAAWLPGTLSRLKLLRQQSACLNDAPPARAVTLDTRPRPNPNLIPSDPELHPFQSNDLSGIGRVPAAWLYLLPHVSTQSPTTIAAVLFMHRLRSPGGNERLVVIEALQPGGLQTFVIVPATLTTPPRLAGTSSLGASSDPWPHNAFPWDELKGLLVYAPLLDPAHPDHVTLPLKLNGRDSAIDAWLRDDDVIQYQPRPSPTPTP